MKFSLTLPIILSALYTSFSQAQNSSLPPCAISCATAGANQTGCNITNPTSTSCFCTDEQFVKLALGCVLTNCNDTDSQTVAEKYWDSVCKPLLG